MTGRKFIFDLALQRHFNTKKHRLAPVLTAEVECMDSHVGGINMGFSVVEIPWEKTGNRIGVLVIRNLFFSNGARRTLPPPNTQDCDTVGKSKYYMWSKREWVRFWMLRSDQILEKSTLRNRQWNIGIEHRSTLLKIVHQDLWKIIQTDNWKINYFREELGVIWKRQHPIVHNNRQCY